LGFAVKLPALALANSNLLIVKSLLESPPVKPKLLPSIGGYGVYFKYFDLYSASKFSTFFYIGVYAIVYFSFSDSDSEITSYG
jgi:hypothetical protein